VLGLEGRFDSSQSLPNDYHLGRLAEHADVATAFVALGLVRAVLSSLLERQINEIVKTLLATALSKAVLLSDAQMCQEARNDLSHTLRDALSETSHMVPVYQELERAYAHLTFGVPISTC